MGFAEYAATFKENDVDGKVLMNLTEQDLIDMGIASEGTRMSLLEQVHHTLFAITQCCCADSACIRSDATVCLLLVLISC